MATVGYKPDLREPSINIRFPGKNRHHTPLWHPAPPLAGHRAGRRGVPTPDDGARCRPSGGSDLSRYRRRAGALSELQGGRCSVWTDALQVSIGRGQPNRRHITVRRRDDAGDALRSGLDHADPHQQMVMAKGMGDEDRQTPRSKEGDRGAGAPVGRDHAPHMG